MSYEYHHEGLCDKCNKDIGKDNLINVPFIYKDLNDKAHEDLGDVYGKKYKGYRQYRICHDCMKIELRIIKRRNGR